jgi:hypothetical protein
MRRKPRTPGLFLVDRRHNRGGGIQTLFGGRRGGGCVAGDAANTRHRSGKRSDTDAGSYVVFTQEGGIDLPYSCRAGACSSCAGKVTVRTTT